MRYQYFKVFLEMLLAWTLAPLVIVMSIPIMMYIFVVSPGNPFYLGKRVGKNGKVFKIIKFRTMFLNAHDIEKQNGIRSGDKLKPDPRIYPGGLFLRRWSLDELPQIFNVIRGEMSFIGPRPGAPSEIQAWIDAGYGRRIAIRLKALPGISGLAQIKGRGNLSAGEKLRYDTVYVKGLSFCLDLSIWLKTPVVVIQGTGAY